MASRHELRARHTEEKQKQNPQQRFKRNMAVAALVGMTAAAAIGVFAKTYYIDNGDITIDGNDITYYDDDKNQQQGKDDNITITQHDSEIATDNTITIIADEDETVAVTIKDINIEATEKIDPDAGYTKDNYEAAISIEGAGDVVLELEGDNVVKSGYGHAGVETAGSGMLTIEDEDHDGSLDAMGGHSGAGIGGGVSGDGNVTINGGEITATGGYIGAGIGSGNGGGSNITINGGKIEAIGSNNMVDIYDYSGAGIGAAGILGQNGKDHTVIINGGEINALGTGGASGIGGACVGKGNTIEINGGKINATAAGYGSGIGGDNAIIEINGGEISASTSGGKAGIGGTCSKITIMNGTISASGGSYGAGIGGSGGEEETETGDIFYYGVDITITGGTVNAVGGVGAAGIGGKENTLANVTIVGGNVTATVGERKRGRQDADAIGSGAYDTKKPQSTVVYDGGTIIEQPHGWDADGHEHTWEVSEYTAPTYEAGGVAISFCECGSKKTEFLSALAPDEQMPLTVTTLLSTAQPYEQTMENGRVTFAAPAQDAILTGSLGALAELKAKGAQTLVFRTQLCETSVSIDKLLAAGSADDVLVLTHKGTEAVLTVAGRVVE